MCYGCTLHMLCVVAVHFTCYVLWLYTSHAVLWLYTSHAMCCGCTLHMLCVVAVHFTCYVLFCNVECTDICQVVHYRIIQTHVTIMDCTL